MTLAPQFLSDEAVKCNATALATNWTMQGHTISYCLVDQQTTQCRLQFSQVILLIVISCNIVKAICMFCIAYKVKESSLITIVDAIASYLSSPDPTAQQQRFLPKQDVAKRKSKTAWIHTSQHPHETQNAPEPRAWSAQRIRWLHSPSWQRWTLCMVFGFGCVILAASVPQKFGSDRNVAFQTGAAEEFGLPLLSTMPFVNMWQGILSLFYPLLNGTLTAMIMNAEWASYVTNRTPLRTTRPKGQQRSTSWLQLPYRRSIPFLITMTTLRWGLSQFIFLLPVKMYKRGVEQPDLAFTGIGYSAVAILSTWILPFLLLLVILGFGIFKKYPPGTPIVGGLQRGHFGGLSSTC
jgi:hypothetical protein